MSWLREEDHRHLPGQNANMLHLFVTDATERGVPLFSGARETDLLLVKACLKRWFLRPLINPSKATDCIRSLRRLFQGYGAPGSKNNADG